ncbi:MAG: class I SAM-dependent methyltransferase [Anaerolineales bacterium]|jgi:SAM-dependent methyltransferase
MSQPESHDEYKVIAEMYDYIVPYRERADVGFFVEAAKESGGAVLEVGCGTGRVLIPTARAGIEITGLDHSPDMLAVCQERLQAEAQGIRSWVRLVEADMRQFELARTFQLVTLPFRPFQHLTTVADQLACLGCIHKHLGEGGKLILDIFNPKLESLVDTNFGIEMADEPEFSLPDGRKVIRRHSVVSRDVANQINHIELIYYVTHPDGRQERLVQAFPMRYLFRFEAEHLLERAGFKVEQLYADYDKSPYGSKYPGELIFVAGKLKD